MFREGEMDPAIEAAVKGMEVGALSDGASRRGPSAILRCCFLVL